MPADTEPAARSGRRFTDPVRAIARRTTDRLRNFFRRSGAGYRFALGLAAATVMIATAIIELSPMLSNFRTYGFHDWDVETAYRYITVLSLKRYHQAPWWHPWLCGGFPAFGHHEAASNLISPWLPLYLLSDLRVAFRLEVLAGALIGLVGTYLLAGRFTRSVGLCLFVAVIYAVNGRWALQASVGHTWHLQYAWLPWVLWSFEGALQPERLWRAAVAGAILALMVFAGGIYPVPHTALILVAYAVLLVPATRSLRPLVALAIAGTVAVGLAAPKLFAVADAMSRAPRLIESKESIGFAELLVMLTEKNQSYTSRFVRTPAYGWHEWGIYIGWIPLVCLLLAVLFARGTRENALKLIGVGLLFLGFGDFNDHAPWALLHRLPVFASQHVPSRFHYPMVLVLGLCFASWAGSFVDRRIARRPWLDVVLVALAAAIAGDLASAGQRPFAEAFWMEAPDVIKPAEPFEQRVKPVVTYKRPDWAAPVLLGMFANTGLIECYGLDPNFKGIGAIGADAPNYRGRAYIASGTGTAEVVDWSPNRAVVQIKGATENALVVYNMNYDPSWRADGKPAENYANAVSTRVSAGDQRIVFRYFPRTLKWSLPVCFFTLASCIAGPLWWRRRKRRARSA